MAQRKTGHWKFEQTSKFLDETDLMPLDGTWIPTSGEMAGAPLTPEILEALRGGRLIIEGDRYWASFGGQVDEGTTRVDPTGETADIDIQGEAGPNAGRTIRAIFRLDADELEVCYALDGGPRPATFGTVPGTQQMLLRYSRAGA